MSRETEKRQLRAGNFTMNNVLAVLFFEWCKNTV